MITSPQEYWKLLYVIQDQNTEFAEKPIPDSELRYNIDLEKRTVEAPKILGAQNDDKAEWIYFRCPRYFDSMDLALTTCIIMYTNANGDDRIYPVPFYDAVTEEAEQNLLIPWQLGGDVTKYAGEVEFAIRFYQVDADNHQFVYCLNTQPAKSEVLPSMNTTNGDDFNYTTSFMEEILDKIAKLQKAYEVYWLEVE